MANETRYRADGIKGTVDDNPLTSGATTLTSTELANLPAIGSTEHAVIILDPEGAAGAPEIVYVTAHTASATTATIVRGKEGSSARQHAVDTPWVHGPIASDFIRGFKHFKRTGGNLTLNSTSWSNLPTIGTTWDVTLPASVGDTLEADLSGITNDEAVEAHLDVWTIVAGTATNQFGSNNGVSAWWGRNGHLQKAAGSVMYTLASGDISSGLVTVRLRYKTSAAVNKTLFASSDLPLQFSVKNLSLGA